MQDSDEPNAGKRPVGRFNPSQKSIQIAEIVAGWMGQSFDPVENQKIVERYHEQLFQNILDTLDLPRDTVQFTSGSLRKTTTFAAKNVDSNEVVLDEMFDFWTWDITHLTCVAAFEVLKEDEWEKLIADLGKVMLVYSNAEMHETVRESFGYYILNYKRIIQFSHTLSNAILGFALCHEIAHCQLGHLDKPPSKEVELEADILAAQHFTKIIEKSQSSNKPPFFLLPAHYTAPLISMELLGLHEYWLHLNDIETSRDSLHPSPSERKDNIIKVIKPALTDEAPQFYEGFQNAVNDIRHQMAKYI